MNETLLPTTLVGSYAQPNWLIDRKRRGERFPPRVRARELWRVSPEFLDEARLHCRESQRVERPH
jgi:5-methyltetrahydropteroyltriglutamate--homocysteine methyltransferase